MGFLTDISKILTDTLRHKQVSVFSANLDRNVLQLSEEFMRLNENLIHHLSQRKHGEARRG